MSFLVAELMTDFEPILLRVGVVLQEAEKATLTVKTQILAAATRAQNALEPLMMSSIEQMQLLEEDAASFNDSDAPDWIRNQMHDDDTIKAVRRAVEEPRPTGRAPSAALRTANTRTGKSKKGIRKPAKRRSNPRPSNNGGQVLPKVPNSRT